MLVNQEIIISYKHPVSGERVKFTRNTDVPENSADNKSLGEPFGAWAELAKTQFLTSFANKHRREEVDKVAGKAVGVRTVLKEAKEAGLSAEQLSALIARVKSGEVTL